MEEGLRHICICQEVHSIGVLPPLHPILFLPPPISLRTLRVLPFLLTPYFSRNPYFPLNHYFPPHSVAPSPSSLRSFPSSLLTPLPPLLPDFFNPTAPSDPPLGFSTSYLCVIYRLCRLECPFPSFRPCPSPSSPKGSYYI